MIFSNISFTLKYLDPSAAANGDGTSPETPMNVFPGAVADLGDNTAWVIRRTAETASALLPRGSSGDIQNILFIGMPKSTDKYWNLMPTAAREAWGADEAEYANIRADTGTEPWGEEFSFSLTAGKTFLMHRIYLFRDNTPAYMPIIKFPAQDYTAEISLEHCKFGAKGIDLNLETFTAAVTSSSCQAYLNINTAQVFSMHDCIVNIVNGGDGYYGETSNPVNLCNANFIAVSEIDVYATTSQYGGEAGPGSGTALNFSNGSWGGAFTDYQNIRFHILVNGTWGYMPSLFYSAVNDYCFLRNMTASVETRRLGTDNPTIFCVSQPIIRSLGSREFHLEKITVNLPKCWRISEGGRVVSISGWGNSTIPGHSKSVKNISIQMAETDGVDSEKNGNYYDWVKYGTGDINQYAAFSALELSFSERSYAEGAWEPVTASGINVNHPHGVALYGYGFQLRDCAIKGAVKLRRCIADIETVTSYYPGYALFAAEAATLRVGTLTLGRENAETTGGADDPAVGSRYSDAGFIYVEASNGALKSNIGDTATNVWNGYNVICGNETDAGHYTCRSVNYLCDTWNTHRTGGAPACMKFTSSANGSGSMSLGRAPFQGIRITPSATGLHTLTLHIAAKGLTSLDELNRKLLVQVTVPRADGASETIFSSNAGQWLDDAGAEWVNDSEMELRRLVMPVNITETGALDVKIHYSLYSASGYVYIDPAVELAAVAGE